MHDQIEDAEGWLFPNDRQAHIETSASDQRPSLQNHQFINASKSNEWYTPGRYVEAARAVMGGIDLDPASSSMANEVIMAERYFTFDDNGLTKSWSGRVWLNPPYGREKGESSNQARWSMRLIEQFRTGATEQAILLVNAATGSRWFGPLWDFPICFPDHRIQFYNETGICKQPTHSNALVYFGRDLERFTCEFSKFGAIIARL